MPAPLLPQRTCCALNVLDLERAYAHHNDGSQSFYLSGEMAHACAAPLTKKDLHCRPVCFPKPVLPHFPDCRLSSRATLSSRDTSICMRVDHRKKRRRQSPISALRTHARGAWHNIASILICSGSRAADPIADRPGIVSIHVRRSAHMHTSCIPQIPSNRPLICISARDSTFISASTAKASTEYSTSKSYAQRRLAPAPGVVRHAA